MASIIDTAAGKIRQEKTMLAPSAIAKGLNSRIVPAPNYADQVRNRAISIHESGQIQPVEVRKDSSGALILTLGFTRYDAVELLREGFEYEGKRYHDPEAKLWVTYTKATEEEAFDRGVTENQERNNTTDLQEAKAQEYYRTKRGWNDTQIAKFYGYTNQNRVMALKKLLTLSESVQGLVHEGRMSLSAAIDTLKLPEEQRAAVVQQATTESGKVDGAAIRSTIRQNTATEKPEEPKPTTVQKATIKDFNDFVDEYTKATDAKEGVKEMLETLSLWFAGRRTDKYLTQKLETLIKK